MVAMGMYPRPESPVGATEGREDTQGSLLVHNTSFLAYEAALGALREFRQEEYLEKYHSCPVLPDKALLRQSQSTRRT